MFEELGPVAVRGPVSMHWCLVATDCVGSASGPDGAAVSAGSGVTAHAAFTPFL
jgi:hypothetical protein